MARSIEIPSTAGDHFYRLWVLLNQVMHVAHKAQQRELSPAHVSVIEASVLFVLANAKGPVTPAEMARWTLREGHSTSMLLDRMSVKGLITKTKDLKYKHLIRLALTEKGRMAYKQSQKFDSIKGILSSLSEEERQQLDASLRKLRDAALAELAITNPMPFP